MSLFTVAALKSKLLERRAQAAPDDQDAGVSITTIIVASALQGQKRKRTGRDSITHSLEVAAHFAHDPELYQIAKMHDLIEDTRDLPPAYRWTFADLDEIGFSPRVVNALRALTREEDEPYLSFVERMSRNPDAVLVKIADLEDNMKDLVKDRSALKPSERERMRKYALCKAYAEAVRDGGVDAGSSIAAFAASHEIEDPVTRKPFGPQVQTYLLTKYALPKDEEGSVSSRFASAARRPAKSTPVRAPKAAAVG
jgi:hypothetical protein